MNFPLCAVMNACNALKSIDCSNEILVPFPKQRYDVSALELKNAIESVGSIEDEGREYSLFFNVFAGIRTAFVTSLKDENVYGK